MFRCHLLVLGVFESFVVVCLRGFVGRRRGLSCVVCPCFVCVVLSVLLSAFVCLGSICVYKCCFQHLRMLIGFVDDTERVVPALHI